MSNMHFQTPPNSTRGSTPEHEVQDGLTRRTGGLPHKLKQDDAPVDTMTRSRPASRTMSSKRSRPRSLDSSGESSDDSVIEPITPPPILRQLSRFVKRAKMDPKQYQRDVADVLDSLFIENQSCPDESVTQVVVPEGNVDLEHGLQQLSPVAVAQAVVTMHAEVEFRRARALTRAHEIHATAQRLRLLHMVLEDESEVYANATLEPLDTSIEEIFKCTKNQTQDNMHQGITMYSQEVMSFAAADSQLDHFEGIAQSNLWDEERIGTVIRAGLRTLLPRHGTAPYLLLSAQRSDAIAKQIMVLVELKVALGSGQLTIEDSIGIRSTILASQKRLQRAKDATLIRLVTPNPSALNISQRILPVRLSQGARVRPRPIAPCPPVARSIIAGCHNHTSGATPAANLAVFESQPSLNERNSEMEKNDLDIIMDLENLNVGNSFDGDSDAMQGTHSSF
ncbi:hypothetical protein EDD22DRAFT_854784 [Suillus occidentalis]|nr:hypothetical protein EDD22DRAFT_854784 [Suillus occidentalis]